MQYNDNNTNQRKKNEKYLIRTVELDLQERHNQNTK